MSGHRDMTFLLDGKLIFDVRNAELRHIEKESVIELDPLEHAVLTDLVTSHGQLVPYEQLFRHWSSRYISEGVLTRVISSLRNKFRLFEELNISIKNRPKQGYVIEASIESKAKSPKLPLRTAVYIAILAFVVSVLFLVFENSKITEGSATIGKYEYTPLATSKGRKAMLAFNSSFSHLSFNTLNPETNKDEISIVSLVDGTSFNYAEEHGLYSPVWLDENRIVYRAKSKGYCQIKIAELDSQKRIVKTLDVVGCNSQSYFGDIEVLNENTILYTDAIAAYGPAHLFKLDLTSFISKMIAVSDLTVVGIYKVIVPKNSNLAALLVSEDLKSTTVRIVDLDNVGAAIASVNTGTLNMSVAWDGKTLVAKSKNSNLNYYELRGSEFTLKESMPIFDSFTGVVNVPNGVAFILGNNYVKQLYLHDTNSQLTEQLTQLTNSPMLSAVFASKNRIYFVSSDTGIDQIRRIDLETGDNRQLSDFITSTEIQGLQVNPSQTYMVASTVQGSEVFSINQEDNSLSSEASIDGVFANVTDREVFYAKTAGTGVNLYRFDLLTKQTELVFEGASFGNRYNDEIIFTFEKRPGVWRLVDGEPELMFDTAGNTRRLLVRDQEIHMLGISGDYYIYDGHKLQQQEEAPRGYQLEDIYGEFYLLNKASLKHTKVVALQDKTND